MLQKNSFEKKKTSKTMNFFYLTRMGYISSQKSLVNCNL